MLKMTIDNEEVLSNNDISIKEEILSPSSTILNNVYPKSWEQDKDYTSRFYYPKDYSKLNIQNFSVEPEEAGTTIQINGNATLNDVDTSKESRVLRLLGQTSQNGTPTPSSPIPVNVVSGDNYINICGKNRIDNSNLNYLTSNVSRTYNTLTTIDTGIRYKTTYSSGFPNVMFKLMDLTPFKGKVVRMKANFTNGEISLGLCNADGTSVDYKANTRNSNTVISFTVPNDLGNTPYLQFRLIILRSLTDEIDFTNLILTIDEEDTTYEPYIGSSYPIYLGVENLFDGVFRQGNRYTTGLSDTTRLFTTQNYQAKSGVSYTISTTLNTSIYKYAINLSVNEWPIAGGTSYFYDSGWKQTSTFTFTPSQDGYLGITVAKINGTDNLTPNDIASYTWQLEKGSKANSYTPYGTTPIELCKIGTYQDYIYKDNGSWYLHKEIGKVVFNGSETGWYKTSDTSASVFVISNQFNDRDTTQSARSISNYFKYQFANSEGKFYFGSTTNTAFCMATTYTLETFKTWLSTHNTIVYYVLATPTNTLIEDTTLIEQLEALSS